jgi:hypothetical protein
MVLSLLCVGYNPIQWRSKTGDGVLIAWREGKCQRRKSFNFAGGKKKALAAAKAFGRERWLDRHWQAAVYDKFMSGGTFAPLT